MIARPFLVLVLGAGLACGASSSAFAQSDATTPFQATTLSLSAEGEVRIAPDEAFLQTGVSTDATTAAAAVAQNRAAMNAVTAAMTAQGISGPDVQTSALELSPQYVDDGKAPRRLTGYQAHNIVTVRVRDLARVGAVVDALVASGANEIEGVSFDRADRGPADDQARRAAVRALQAKAALYAEAAGYHVKRLVRLSEQGTPVFAPMARMAADVAVSGVRRPTPVAPGELTVRASVSADYELSR